jgi:hypothetical protein
MPQPPTLDAPPSADPLVDAVPFDELHERYPHVFPHKSTPEWLLRMRKENGLDEYVLWAGSRPLILRSDLLAWLKRRVQQPARRR